MPSLPKMQGRKVEIHLAQAKSSKLYSLSKFLSKKTNEEQIVELEKRNTSLKASVTPRYNVAATPGEITFVVDSGNTHPIVSN